MATGDSDPMDVDEFPAAPEMPAKLRQLDPAFYRLGPDKICGKPLKEEDAEASKGTPLKKKARRSEDQHATAADQPDIKDFAGKPAEQLTGEEKPKRYTGTNYHTRNKRWRALLSFSRGSATGEPPCLQLPLSRLRLAVVRRTSGNTGSQAAGMPMRKLIGQSTD